MKQLLLRSYDAPLNEPENKKLETALEKSAALRQKKKEIDDMRTKVADFEADFSIGFTEKLMQRIVDDNGFAFLAVFRAIALSGVAAIILVLLTVYFTDGSLNMDSLLGIHGYAPDLGFLTIF